MPAFSTWRRFVSLRPCLVIGLVLCARLASGASSPASATLPGKAAALQVRKVELLSGDRTGFMRPVWSPDGQWLGLGRSGMEGIELLRRDGKGWKTLTADPGSGYKFAWSPDGGHIAYRAMHSESNATTYVIKSVELATGTKAKRAIETCGPTFLNVFSPCPTNWKSPPAAGMEICRKAVETNFWPLIEIVDGKWKLNYEPLNRKPIDEFLAGQKRFRHLLEPKNAGLKKQLQKEVDDHFAELLQLAKIR